MKTRTLLALFAIGLSIASCGKDDDIEDKVEQVHIYISAQTDFYYELFDSSQQSPYEGMQIREEGQAQWRCVNFNYISGFIFEKGYEYKLLVRKTTISNPPLDGDVYSFELIEVLEKNKTYLFQNK